MAVPLCVRTLISGRVQGVYFRACTRDQANKLGLRGFVCNLPDGRVEAVIAGERAVVEELIAWFHQGSPRAKVERVVVDEINEPEGLGDAFGITHS